MSRPRRELRPAGLRYLPVSSVPGTTGRLPLPPSWDVDPVPLDCNELLLDNEVESDVEFIVGPDGDTWRIPGHRDVLSDNSPVFKAMLTGPMAHGAQVRIDDIDGRAFYQLLRVLYGADPEIRSEQTCLMTMYAANKYLCTQLFLHCVEVADSFLRPANVLRIMQTVKFFVPKDLDVETAFQPTAPPLTEYVWPEGAPVVKCPSPSTKVRVSTPQVLPSLFPPGHVYSGAPPVQDVDFPDPTKESNMGWYCGALYWNCIQFIDAYIDEVLECEYMEELHHEDLMQLLRRDSLYVQREHRLFNALVRWADRDCKRRGVRVCAENKRKALGEAVYYVRYLRMNTDELLGGPIKSGLLDPSETACILGLAIGKSQTPPDSLKPYINLLATPRPKPRPCYIHLSTRSKSRAVTKISQSTMTDWCYPADMTVAEARLETKRQARAMRDMAKRMRKEEKRMQRRVEQGPRGRRKCSSSCFAEVFFSVLACIFD